MWIYKVIFHNVRHIKKLLCIFLLVSSLTELCSCNKENKVTFARTPGLDNRIVTLTENGQYNEVLRLYEERLAEISEESYEAANIHVLIGDVYLTYKKDYDKAVEYLNKAIEISEKNKHMLIWADASYAMSNLYVEMGGDPMTGLKYAEQAEKLYKQHSGENTIEVADTIHNKGRLLLEQEERHEALENFKEAEHIYELLHEETGRTSVYIGITLFGLNEFDRAEEAFLKAQRIAENKGKGYYVFKSKFYIAAIYLKRKEYIRSIELYEDILNSFEPDGSEYDIRDTAVIYYNLGYCLKEESGRWEDGITYAIRACREINKLEPITEKNN